MIMGFIPDTQTTKGRFVPDEKQETIPQLLKRNLIGAAKTTYREGIAPFVHAASALTFDVPRTAAEIEARKDISGRQVKESIFPEQESVTGKVLRFSAEAPATVFGGAGRFATKAFEKGAKIATKGILGKIAQGAMTGGAFGLATTKPTAKEYAENVGSNIAMGGAFPVAGKILYSGGKIIGYAASNVGKFISKNVGGVTEASRDIINRLGANRVFEPLKARADYIGTVVVPKVKERIGKIVVEARDRINMRNLGIDDLQINELKSLNKDYKQQLASVLTGEKVNIRQGIQGIEKNAKDRFSALMKQQNPNKAIDVKDFYYKLKGTLLKSGWIDRGGAVNIKYGKNSVRDQLLSIYENLTKAVKTDTGGYKKYIINIPEYENIRSALDMAVSGHSDDRLLFELGGKLRDSASKTIKGLDIVNKYYTDAMRLKDIEDKGLFTRIFDEATLESRLNSMKNVYRTKKNEPMKNVIGQDLYDDVMAHFVNKDFDLVSDNPGAGGGVSTAFGPKGFIKPGITKATKAYYTTVKPTVKNLIKEGKGILSGSAKELKSSMISEETKKNIPSVGLSVKDVGLSDDEFIKLKAKELTQSKTLKELYMLNREAENTKNWTAAKVYQKAINLKKSSFNSPTTAKGETVKSSAIPQGKEGVVEVGQKVIPNIKVKGINEYKVTEIRQGSAGENLYYVQGKGWLNDKEFSVPSKQGIVEGGRQIAPTEGKVGKALGMASLGLAGTLGLSKKAEAEEISQEDKLKAILGEAEGEGLDGMRAISSAIDNRGTLKGVYGKDAIIIKDGQYYRKTDKGLRKLSPLVIKQAKQAIEDANKKDYADGATNWEGTAFKEPYWAKSMTFVKQVKNQKFYKPKK